MIVYPAVIHAAEPTIRKSELPAGMVARVGDDAVSADQLRTAFKAELWLDRATSSPQGAVAVDWVGRLLASRAFQRAADRLGAQADPGYKAALKLAVSHTLGSMAAADMAYDMYAVDPPADVQSKLYEFYKHLGYIPSLRFNYIFLRTSGMNERQKAAKGEEAAKIRRRVTDGKEDFYKVLGEVSEAPQKSTDNYVVDAGTPGFDPKMWDRLAAMKPQTVSDVIESPEGFYIFRLDRSTVIRPAADFAGHDLGEVDRFFFNQWLFKAPINTLFLEYQVRTPVYLKSPGDPLPPRDSVLVQVGAQRLTLAELDDARAFYGRPPLEQHGLFRESWTNLQHMTLAERTRRMGLDGLASGSLGLADGISAINQLFIKKKTLAGLGDPTADQLREYWQAWKKVNGRLPVVAGWTLRLRPRKDARVTPLELHEEIDAIRKRVAGGEAPDKLAAAYGSEKFQIEALRQDAAMLAMLTEENPDWPTIPPVKGKSEVSSPVRQSNGYALFIVSERRSGSDWKFEPLRPMLKNLWQQEQAQKAINAIAQNVQDGLEIDPAQIGALAGERAALLAALPPALKQKKAR